MAIAAASGATRTYRERIGQPLLLRETGALSFERCGRQFLRRSGMGEKKRQRRFQVTPPSAVRKTRPSVAVTVAERASAGVTATRSTGSGNFTTCHLRPSAGRRTAPALPTHQQTVDDGATP